MSSNIWYQPFVAVSGNLGGKIPVVDNVLSSHEQEIYPTTSVDENCVEFEFQWDWNCYVKLRQTYLALKVEIVKGRGYETSSSEEVKKERKEEAKTEENGALEEDALVPLVPHVNNICTQFFSNVEVYINSQQIYNSNRLYAHKSFISNNLKGAISEYNAVLHCEGYDFEEFLDEIMEAPLSQPFPTRRMKMLCRPDGFMLYGKLWVDFFCTSDLFYPNMKISLRLIRARPKFYMISQNPHVCLGIVDCSLYTRRIALKDDYHKKRMDMLAYTPVEFNYLETLAKIFIIAARQNQFIQKKHFQQCSSSSDCYCNEYKLSFHNFISEKLEYLEEVSQLLILMLLIIVAFMWKNWELWTFKMISPQFQLIISKTTMY